MAGVSATGLATLCWRGESERRSSVGSVGEEWSHPSERGKALKDLEAELPESAAQHVITDAEKRSK